MTIYNSKRPLPTCLFTWFQRHFNLFPHTPISSAALSIYSISLYQTFCLSPTTYTPLPPLLLSVTSCPHLLTEASTSLILDIQARCWTLSFTKISRSRHAIVIKRNSLVVHQSTAQSSELLLCARKVQGVRPRPEDRPSWLSFSRFLQAHMLDMPQITPRPLPYAHLRIHYSLIILLYLDEWLWNNAAARAESDGSVTTLR